MEKTRTSQRRF